MRVIDVIEKRDCNIASRGRLLTGCRAFEHARGGHATTGTAVHVRGAQNTLLQHGDTETLQRGAAPAHAVRTDRSGVCRASEGSASGRSATGVERGSAAVGRLGELAGRLPAIIQCAGTYDQWDREGAWEGASRAAQAGAAPHSAMRRGTLKALPSASSAWQ